MLFRWGCPSFHFLLYNINSTSSPILTYSNIFLFTTASFYFLIYNINVTFYATLTYFNTFHFTTPSFQLLIYNLNLTFYPILMYSNIFLFTNACFTPLWYFNINFLIGGVTCCLTCPSCFIHKTWLFWISLRCNFLSFVSGLFFSVRFFNFLCTILPWLISYDPIYQKTLFVQI